jgi:hypothetical protein
MSILEAKCKKCGDTFNPHSEDPDDMIHFIRTSGDEHDGDECGGEGEVTGEYFTPTEWARVLRGDPNPFDGTQGR